MPKVWMSTGVELPGPWLLNAEKLEALNKLIDTEWVKLTQYREAAISQRVADRFDDAFKRHTAYRHRLKLDDPEVLKREEDAVRKEVQAEAIDRLKLTRDLHIDCAGGRKIDAVSFAEAQRQPEVRSLRATGFTLDLVAADITCEVSISDYSDELKIAITPEHEPAAKELFASLHAFFEREAQPRPVRVWRKINPAPQGLVLLAIWLSIYPAIQRTAQPHPLASDIGAMLKSGVSEANQPKAVELLLRLQVTPGPSIDVSIAHWWFVAVAGGVVLITLLSLIPRFELGIGAGRFWIRFYTWVIRIVYVAIPAHILSAYLFPAVKDLISGFAAGR